MSLPVVDTSVGPVRIGPYEVPRPIFFVALGLVLALLLQVIPGGRLFGFGAGAFAHELGHAVTANYLGRPAFPFFVVTVWRDQKLLQSLIMWGLTVYGAWWCWKEERRPFAIALGVLALLYPALAFTRLLDLLCLLGGHGGEAVFAAFCFWRALEGGLHDERERPIYGALAWALPIQNVLMCRALMTDPAARETYHSRAFTDQGNDYVRVAELLLWRLESVSFFMLVVSIVVPLTGVALWWFGSSKGLWDREHVSYDR